MVTSLCYLDYVLFLTISRWRLMLIWQVSRELNEMHLFKKKQKLKRNWQVMSKISQVWCQKFLIMSTLKRRNRKKHCLHNIYLHWNFDMTKKTWSLFNDRQELSFFWEHKNIVIALAFDLLDLKGTQSWQHMVFKCWF